MQIRPIPNDSKYIPLTQQKYCCVPTCIQMVMLSHNIPLVPSELIGYHLGLVVPESEQYLFWSPRVGSEPPAGYGTQVGKNEYSPNRVFKNLGIPLSLDFKLVDNFSGIHELRSYLKNLKEDIDVLVCFDSGTLFDHDDHHGHVCVLDKINLEKGDVRIIDPEQDSPKWRVVKIENLYEAMKYHGKEKSGGFWELTINK